MRQHFALSVLYDVPKTKAENRFLEGLPNGYEIGSVYLAQTGQPVSRESTRMAPVSPLATVPQAKFGLAFNETSGACLTRADGNEEGLRFGTI